MKVTFNNTEIELKYSFRALMMYENIAEKSFAPTTLTDLITLFYCILVTSSKDYSIKFDDFMDLIDENPDLVNDFSTWILTLNEVQDGLKKK